MGLILGRIVTNKLKITKMKRLDPEDVKFAVYVALTVLSILVLMRYFGGNDYRDEWKEILNGPKPPGMSEKPTVREEV